MPASRSRTSLRTTHTTRTPPIISAAAAEDLVIHSLNLAEVLVGGVRAGRGQEMLADLEASGIQVADRPPGEPLRLASLRAGSGLTLPDCCALDTTLNTASTLATFDEALAKAGRGHHVPVAPGTPPQRPHASG